MPLFQTTPSKTIRWTMRNRTWKSGITRTAWILKTCGETSGELKPPFVAFGPRPWVAALPHGTFPFAETEAMLAHIVVGRNLESTGVLGIGPWLGSGHGVVLVGRHGHTEMTALSALSRANGHGILAELLAQIHDCSEGGLLVILVRGSRGRAKVAEVAVVTMLEVPLVTRFRVLRHLHRAWQGSHGEKKMIVGASQCFFVSSRLELVGAGQGIKTIGMLLQMMSECSFMQRDHSLASAAPLK
jgi:hypothetical protein